MMENLSFTFVFLVMHEEEGHGGIVPVLPEGLQSFLLISCVHNEGLEIEKVEIRKNLRCMGNGGGLRRDRGFFLGNWLFLRSCCSLRLSIFLLWELDLK